MEKGQLRNAGLKATVPRMKILEILENADQHHMSAEDVYKALLSSGDDVGLATVYRVLTQFEAVGLLKRHNFEGGASIFEIEQGEHHDHLVCVECARVEEFVDEIIEREQESIAKKAGFEITDHRLTLYGRCHQCVVSSKEEQ